MNTYSVIFYYTYSLLLLILKCSICPEAIIAVTPFCSDEIMSLYSMCCRVIWCIRPWPTLTDKHAILELQYDQLYPIQRWRGEEGSACKCWILLILLPNTHTHTPWPIDWDWLQLSLKASLLRNKCSRIYSGSTWPLSEMAVMMHNAGLSDATATNTFSSSDESSSL